MIISAPGKLFIAGEWAILKVSNPGIIATIDKRAFVNIKKSPDKKIHITAKDFKISNLKATFDGKKLKFERKLNKKEREKLSFLEKAIEVALLYQGDWKPFQIKTWSREMSKKLDDGVEIGLGSSAAIVVATVAAILRFHKINIQKNKNKIYKLSTIAHYFVQGKVGSAFDIAASTFGGTFVYKRFNPKWLKSQIKKGKTVREIVKLKWPGFYFENLTVPRNFHLIVGWTKKAASTPAMVKKFYKWKEKNKRECQIIFKKIATLVKKLIRAWKKQDRKEIIKLIRENEEYLRELGKKSKINIETNKLRKLSEIAKEYGAAGKLSGAGGGDCGIAITFNRKPAQRIRKEWRKNNIHPIDINISFWGVREEK